MSAQLLTGTSTTGLARRDLATDIRDGGPWEPHQAAGLAARVARRLEELHSGGRVVDGLTPGRVVLTGDGEVTIVTAHTGSPYRDPRLLAPECSAGQAPTATADWYALGCVLHLLLIDAIPVGYDTAAGWSASIRQLRPGTGENLANLVGALLSVDPRERPRSAADVEQLLSGAIAPRSSRPTTSLVRTRRRWSRRVRRLTGMGSAVSATVVVLGGAVLLTTGTGDDAQSGPAAGSPVTSVASAAPPSTRAKATRRPSRNQPTPRPAPKTAPTVAPTVGPAIEPSADPVVAGQAATLHELATLLRTDPRATRSRSLRAAASTLDRAAGQMLGGSPTTASASIHSALAVLTDAQRRGRWRPSAAQSAFLAPLGYQPPAVIQDGRTHRDD